MKKLIELFQKDFTRNIETVIKADDQKHILQEVEEYVITQDISKKLADFFEAYNDTSDSGINGVWISGFFGSGKSHLLKILSYALTNKELEGKKLGEIFASKAKSDAKLKADILNATKKYASESILFNIDQQAQITSKTDANAILQVFYKVFYDHQGFYGFQPHVAEFESYLTSEGKFDEFKVEFEKSYHKSWNEARKDYVDPLISDAIAEACGSIYNKPSEKYEDYLDEWEDRQKFSIEDFSMKVNNYIKQNGGNFRLNFFVDEIGQYIAENTKLMLNLQTIAESLNTKCNGNSWVIVTSQEDLESLVGDDSGIQSDDFSKIQGRFRVRMPLTSANVDEVIEKRLLEKNTNGVDLLEKVFKKEGENLKTLLSFSSSGMQFKGFEGNEDFVSKFPFIPYQFDLFQQCIKALSRHNVFQGKHQSVGERSMLGVFQEVLKSSDSNTGRGLVSFDKMFEGIRSTLRAESQNSILLAEKQLSDNPIAIKALKTLFLIKYYDSFKSTVRNISVLLLDSLDIKPTEHQKKVEEALNLLEQQTYIQRKGEEYEFLTNDEKDVENEIKDTSIEPISVSKELQELIFDGVIGDTKIKYQINKQEFDFTRKVDGDLFGREKELEIEVVSPNGDQYANDSYFSGTTMGYSTKMIIRLPEDKRLIYEVRMALKTDKYIKQSQSPSNSESISRILFEKGQQNKERKRQLQVSLNALIAKSKIYIGGSEYRGSTSSDGKTRVVEAFQDLIQKAYPKLSLLGTAKMDEQQLRISLAKGQTDLFGGNDESLSGAEKEVFNWIKRRKEQHDRTSLSDLKDFFAKKPYGWTQMSVWCVIALLYKRGNIEAKQDTNILEDKAFGDALNNNRQWANTLIEPQIDFNKSDVKLLKEVFQDLFNESNPHNEPKDAALLFKQKLDELRSQLSGLIYQKTSYPFLANLEPLQDVLEQVSKLDYSNLIRQIKDFEDDLIDNKENFLDPILQFWNGEQKKIYDRLLTFLNGNQANFRFIDQSIKEELSQVQESQTPYRGNIMRDAKQRMEELQELILGKIKEEKLLTENAVHDRLKDLQSQKGFDSLDVHVQDKITAPIRSVLSQVKDEKFIASLQLERQNIAELFTKQLNELSEIFSKNGGSNKPVEQFISIREANKHLSFGQGQLSTEEDVDAYVEAIRETLLKQINQNRKITLD
jgi:hypothetical protein